MRFERGVATMRSSYELRLMSIWPNIFGISDAVTICTRAASVRPSRGERFRVSRDWVTSLRLDISPKRASCVIPSRISYNQRSWAYAPFTSSHGQSLTVQQCSDHHSCNPRASPAPHSALPSRPSASPPSALSQLRGQASTLPPPIDPTRTLILNT